MRALVLIAAFAVLSGVAKAEPTYMDAGRVGGSRGGMDSLAACKVNNDYSCGLEPGCGTYVEGQKDPAKSPEGATK